LLRLLLLVARCLSLCVLGIGLRFVLSIFRLGLRLLTLLLSLLSLALVLVLLLLLALVLILVERVAVITLLLLVLLALAWRLRSLRFVSLLRVLKEFNSGSDDTNSQCNLLAEMEKTWLDMLVFTALNEQWVSKKTKVYLLAGR
jgi:hypothetical protein